LKKLIAPFVVIAILAVMVSPVFAQGQIRIDPALPVMLDSPATFTVYIESPEQSPATDPHIFLVMTEDCWNGLTGPVVVTWLGGSISIPKANFAPDTGVDIPPGATPGASYTVASLKSHLGTSGPIYWAFVAFLAGPITDTPQTFTVDLPSTDPRMLVYALGKGSKSTGLFDFKVPPTIPGFVVPELGTMLLVLASLSAFALYAVKRRKV